MPEFLKHWPEHFQQWFLNWESWTVSDKKILTEGTLFRSHNRSHPGPGWDSHRNTQCSPYYTWRSNSPHLWSLWTPWCLCARGEGCVLQVPSSVWFSKSLVEETNSGNDSLTTYTSNFFFFFLNMCANCIQSCEFEDSNVKTRSCIQMEEFYQTASHSSTGSKSNCDFFQVSFNEPSIKSSHCKTGN